MTADISPPGRTAAQILIVDNDARVRAGLRALIDSSQGLSVVGEASSSATALRASEALSPDVVVLDILLPSSDDGLEVLTHLAATGRPVVALSIRAGLRTPALTAGAAAFVEKYAGPDALLETLLAVVSNTPGQG